MLAGRHMVGRDAVRILGRPAFYDLMLVTSGELGYLGNQWRRSVACAGSSLSLQARLGGLRPCCSWPTCPKLQPCNTWGKQCGVARAVQGDISAETMISGVDGVDPARRQMLIDMLDIDLSWWAKLRFLCTQLGLSVPYLSGSSLCLFVASWLTCAP